MRGFDYITGTQVDGTYGRLGVRPGLYRVGADYLGLSFDERDVVIEAGDTAVVDIVMLGEPDLEVGSHCEAWRPLFGRTAFPVRFVRPTYQGWSCSETGYVYTH